MAEQFPIVEIEWYDAHSSLKEISKKSAKKNKAVVVRSIGYMIDENDEGITLVSDTWPDDPKRGFAPHFVGWGMIEKVWILE